MTKEARIIDEVVANGAWKGRGSAPTWVIGEGHKTIEEARQYALDEVAKAEQAVREALAADQEAAEAAKQAFAKRQRTQDALGGARKKLAYAQSDLARRCGFDRGDGDEWATSLKGGGDNRA